MKSFKKLNYIIVYFLRLIIYTFFFTLDSLIWFALKSISRKLLIRILIKRPLRQFFLLKNKKLNHFLKKELLFYLRTRELKFNLITSCLSRSILGRLFFDFFNINNELWFGIFKNEQGKKIAHAWLYDPNLKLDITPSLISKKQISLFKL